MAWVRVDSPSAVAEVMANISHESLYQSAELIAFISSSPAWIYPVDRFFARALYGKWCMEHAGYFTFAACFVEHYYDIDFINSAGQEEIQKRKKILYENYCHLVSAYDCW